ncbi:MAG: alpha/beta hydrolase [Polyangiales bacterium]
MAPPSTFRARFEKRLANVVMSLPRSWLLKLAGGSRIEVEGFVLDEQIQLAIALHAKLGKKHTHQLAVEEARRELEASADVFAPKRRELARVEDRKIPGPAGPIPVRIYVPRGIAQPAPALVFYHGGGFALGSLDSHDAPCRVLADDARCIVVAVDYRLAPEHKFPAAVDDSVAAFRWVASEAAKLGIDPARIAVGGDSAGGNLSAVVAQITRGEARKPAFQLLIYPATDMTMTAPSHEQMGHGFFLEHDTMVWFRDHYLNGPHEQRDPRASPLFEKDLSGLPPAYVVTAGFDPLRDEGEQYANRLREAGVPVEYRCHSSLFHGFISTTGRIERARPTLVECAAALREALRPRGGSVAA